MHQRKNFGQALQHYRTLRSDAHRVVEISWAAEYCGLLRLSDIDPAALVAATVWRKNYPPNRHGHVPGWSWEREVRRLRKRARCVEAALWHDTTLCGLAIGRVSRGHLVASLHFLESSPVGNPLQGDVAPIMVQFLEIMAVQIGCPYVSIENPVDGLIDFYADDLGFKEKVAKHDKILRLMKRIVTVD